LAAKSGFQRGDILLGLHQYETIAAANVSWVFNNPEITAAPIRYFLMRGNSLRRGWLGSE
jgi:serine protease Do